jgi:acetylornithine deacetylase/succinyl-diaminopimelate desuccinylase-like protein
VFPAETDLTIRRDQDRIYGPGLGDNSLGVAGLLAVLDTLQKYHIQPKSDIWFVANSREEGLGDLGGIRAVWSTIGPKLGSAIVLEGMALGRVYNAGIAVRRLHITCHAPGGHSWLHFGQPSAIHGLIDLGSRITAIHPPTEPRTTYNIGLIEGGHSVNSLATSASLYLDLRSEERTSLAALEQKVMRAVETTQKAELTFSTEVVGDRPAGQIPTGHPLVQLAAATLRYVGLNALYETGSTDANVLLANGLPTVTIGISYGGHAHREDEFIETGPIPKGIWQTILLALGAADYLSP